MTSSFPTPRSVWDYIQDLSLRVADLEKKLSKK